MDIFTVYSSPREPADVWWRDPGSRKLEDLVKIVKNSGLNCVGIVNSGDGNNYERWAEQTKSLPPNWHYYQDERVTQIIDTDSFQIYFFKSEELFTKGGHILVRGTKAGKKYPDDLELEQTLKQVEEDPILTIISGHTFAYGRCGKLGTLDGKEKSFHAYEWTSMAGCSNKKTLRKAKTRQQVSSVRSRYSQAEVYRKMP